MFYSILIWTNQCEDNQVFFWLCSNFLNSFNCFSWYFQLFFISRFIHLLLLVRRKHCNRWFSIFSFYCKIFVFRKEKCVGLRSCGYMRLNINPPQITEISNLMFTFWGCFGELLVKKVNQKVPHHTGPIF